MFAELQLAEQVTALCERYRGGIVVAVSGGCDSMALLQLLSDLRREVNFNLAVLHFNFGLRGAEADDDQQHVQKTAQALGVRCDVYRVKAADRHLRKGRSTQEWARLLRQRELRHYCAAHRCCAALAHHRDDLAETALYRIVRGAEVAQLPGMVQFDPPFWRPLLTLSKTCLRSFCVQREIAYREDSTNKENIYARNRLRNLVMPPLNALHHAAAQHIVAVCSQAQELYIEVERELRAQWAEALQRGKLCAAALRALPPCKAKIVLRLLLGNVPQQAVTEVLAQIEGEDKFTRQLRRGQLLVYDGVWLRLQRTADGVKLPRKQQYKQIVQQLRSCFILEPGARAETTDACVQTDTTQPRSVCYHLHRPTQGEKVRWRGRNVPLREVQDLPPTRSLFIRTDAAGRRSLVDDRGELIGGKCKDILLESQLTGGIGDNSA